MTEFRFYGIGSQLLRAGDLALPEGFILPYVLRPTSRLGEYKLVGAAYMQGIMRGDVLDEKNTLELHHGGKLMDIVIV